MRLSNWVSGRVFRFVHGNHLVYNTCWEDPRLDRVALQLGPDDEVLMITSAGCNALDYALCGPRRIHAVDMNPRQNALLELKLAGIRRLDFEEFFELFGKGRVQGARRLYETRLQSALSPAARAYWDKEIDCFQGKRLLRTFYFHGTSGLFARLVNFYIDRVAKVRDEVMSLLAAPDLESQRKIYDDSLREVFWTRFIRWIVSRDGTLSLVGVPRSQRLQVERDYEGGIAKFIEDSVETVFTRLSLQDNYFWRVYLTGEYTRECCPEYLKEENFARLKDGGWECITPHTDSVLDFLRQNPVCISRYVLLDHMDWLSSFSRPVLQEEWQWIMNRAAPATRFLWRSGGLKVDYVDPLEVDFQGRRRQVGDLLQYAPELAAELHERDRVHTYGSCYIAELASSPS